jgi:hypothetical protein
MNSRIYNFLTLTLTLGLLVGCGEKINLNEYIGDGKAEFIGNQTWYPGFKVTFNKFKLSKSFSGRYKIESYPIMDKSYYIGLVGDISLKDDPGFKDGKLSIELHDINGRPIIKCDDYLKNWRYSHAQGSKDCFIYYFENSCVTGFKPKEYDFPKNLILHINYRPTSNLNETYGQLVLSVGGSK